MKIHALAENTPSAPGFLYEHGLSLYIEHQGKNILFDTGASGGFAENAGKMGLDLSRVDFAFLSHGHYDHGGGLRRFTELNSTAPVYISPAAFGDYYNAENKYIGLDRSLEGRSRFVTLEKVKISGSIELYPSFGELAHPLDSAGLTELRDGKLIPDSFLHEQYMLLRENGKRVLFSGCSHSGILNIVEHFEPDVLIGGFHFMKKEILNGKCPELDRAAELLSSHDCIYCTCHCTGLPQYEYLRERMGDRLRYLSSGQSIEI